MALTACAYAAQNVPATAEEYLRMVRRQARKIPSVVVAQKPPQGGAVAQRGGEGGERGNGGGDRSSVYIDVDQCPENLLPSVEWESYYLQVGVLRQCRRACRTVRCFGAFQ